MRNVTTVIFFCLVFTGCKSVDRTLRQTAYNPPPVAPPTSPSVAYVPLPMPDFAFYDTNDDGVMSPKEYAVAAKMVEAQKPLIVGPSSVTGGGKGSKSPLYSANDSTEGFIAVTIAVFLFVLLGLIHSCRKTIGDLVEKWLDKKKKKKPGTSVPETNQPQEISDAGRTNK